jgi:hypothetical protein
MEKVHRLLAAPVLTDLRLDTVGLEIQAGTVTPSRLPGLFAAVPVTVLGRWSGSGTGSLALRATERDGAAWTGTPPAVEGRSGALAALWARGRVRDLEDAYTCSRGHKRGELEKEIVETSLRFSVLSRFTAYVAVDRDAVVEKGGDLHRIVQPVEMPAGWGREMMAGRDQMLFHCIGPSLDDSGSGLTMRREERSSRMTFPGHELVSKALGDYGRACDDKARKALLPGMVKMLSKILRACRSEKHLAPELARIEKLRDEIEAALKEGNLGPNEVYGFLYACKVALDRLQRAAWYPS